MSSETVLEVIHLSLVTWFRCHSVEDNLSTNFNLFEIYIILVMNVSQLLLKHPKNCFHLFYGSLEATFRCTFIRPVWTGRWDLLIDQSWKWKAVLRFQHKWSSLLKVGTLYMASLNLGFYWYANKPHYFLVKRQIFRASSSQPLSSVNSNHKDKQISSLRLIKLS